MTTTPDYRVKYQTSDRPVGRRHRTLSGAVRDLRACQRAAKLEQDGQSIYIVRVERGCIVPLTDDEAESLYERMTA